MQLVIDIPEEVYREICVKNYYSLKGKEALRIGVINGILLTEIDNKLNEALEIIDKHISGKEQE